MVALLITLAQAKTMAFSCKWPGYDIIFTNTFVGQQMSKTLEDGDRKILIAIQNTTPWKTTADVTVADPSGVVSFTQVTCFEVVE